MRPTLRTLLYELPLVAAAALALAAPAAAQGPAPRQEQALVMTMQNRTAEADAARGAPRRDATARPGDVLRYRLTFTNVTAAPVRGVVLSNPVPAGMRLVGESARATRTDARLEYSIDGGRTWAAQPMEEVVEEGRRIRRPASPESYTHVRWTIDGPVAPAATVVAEYEARLGGAPAAAAPAARTPGQRQ